MGAVVTQAVPVSSRTVSFRDLGNIDFQEAWNLQEKVFAELISTKTANRDNPGNVQPTPGHLFFCEHPHVYTLGKSGSEKNLLVNEEELGAKEASFYRINRGGDITYHGPGQVVAYPIIDLENYFTDIHKYMRLLEEAVILTLSEYSIAAGRVEGKTGVWLGSGNPLEERKIAAMGVRCSRWVTMHGLAFNVNCDLRYFGNIIPCGIQNARVTSMEKELGSKQDMQAVKDRLRFHLCNLFGFELSLP